MLLSGAQCLVSRFDARNVWAYVMLFNFRSASSMSSKGDKPGALFQLINEPEK